VKEEGGERESKADELREMEKQEKAEHTHTHTMEKREKADRETAEYALGGRPVGVSLRHLPGRTHAHATARTRTQSKRRQAYPRPPPPPPREEHTVCPRERKSI
jgi:hypothetical protein